MNNLFRDTYATWPFRAFIIKDSKIEYISDIQNAEYDITDIYRFFENR